MVFVTTVVTAAAALVGVNIADGEKWQTDSVPRVIRQVALVAPAWYKRGKKYGFEAASEPVPYTGGVPVDRSERGESEGSDPYLIHSD